MLQVNGISLHVEDHGSGKPVLLLHGWPDSSYFGWHHFACASCDDLNAPQEVVRRSTSARNSLRSLPFSAMNAAPA